MELDTQEYQTLAPMTDTQMLVIALARIERAIQMVDATLKELRAGKRTRGKTEHDQ
jgi:hypothetical protein